MRKAKKSWNIWFSALLLCVRGKVVANCTDAADQRMLKPVAPMSPGGAMLWLQGSDGHLDGARPIVVLQLEGSQPVLAALHAFEEGDFA